MAKRISGAPFPRLARGAAAPAPRLSYRSRVDGAPRPPAALRTAAPCLDATRRPCYVSVIGGRQGRQTRSGSED